MKRSKAHKQAIRKISEHYEQAEVKEFYREAAARRLVGIESIDILLEKSGWFLKDMQPLGDWSVSIDLGSPVEPTIR
jgi:hypothetical protein